MFRRFPAAALLLLLLLLASHGVAQPSSDDQRPKAPIGPSVVIDSRPEHAEIRLDGKFVGTTPLSYRMTPGVHKIELVRSSYSPWIRDLTVTNSPTRVVAILSEAAKKDCNDR